MHALLRRQLKRHFGDGHPPPLQCAGFISAVNAAYEQSDADRERLGRSLELTSQELLQANAELRRRNTELEASLVQLRNPDQTRDKINRIGTIVEELRDVFRINGSDHDAVSVNEALDDTLRRVWDEFQPKAQVRKEYGDVPPVPFNPEELRQVFAYLILNGVHAIDNEGVITVHTFLLDGHAVIEISDTGCDIPDAMVDKISDPFPTTRPAGSGTGLGLWISSSIVHKHGGTISVRSTAGCETTFTIRLPLQAHTKTCIS